MTDKIKALALYLKVSEESISVEYGNVFSSDDEPGEYMVLTDDEANEAWDEELDRYLDECVFPVLPCIAQQYFDREAWKLGAKHDGRGHALSSYDGEEHEVQVDGEWFFLYRVN